MVELALLKSPMIAEMARDKQVEAGRKVGKGNDGFSTIMEKLSDGDNPIHTDKIIAELSGVSHGTVGRVRRILKEGTDDEIKAARSGEQSINHVFTGIRDRKNLKQTKNTQEQTVKPIDSETRKKLENTIKQFYARGSIISTNHIVTQVMKEYTISHDEAQRLVLEISPKYVYSAWNKENHEETRNPVEETPKISTKQVHLICPLCGERHEISPFLRNLEKIKTRYPKAYEAAINAVGRSLIL